MSRMSAWNRPSKHSAIPPPYYITAAEDTLYCHTCGRIMNSRKSTKSTSKGSNVTKTPVKYCSERCRKRKPGPLDREIERAFISLLTGEKEFAPASAKTKPQSKKGDSRILVKMNHVEESLFGTRPNSETTRVGKRNVTDAKEWRSVDMESSESEGDPVSEDDQDHGGAELDLGVLEAEDMVALKPTTHNRIRKDELSTEEFLKSPAETAVIDPTLAEKRDEGQKRAEHKEMVRRAARRGVVFGFAVNHDQANAEIETSERRKCEAVVNGAVVEPSFAKGNWGIRWRE